MFSSVLASCFTASLCSHPHPGQENRKENYGALSSINNTPLLSRIQVVFSSMASIFQMRLKKVMCVVPAVSVRTHLFSALPCACFRYIGSTVSLASFSLEVMRSSDRPVLVSWVMARGENILPRTYFFICKCQRGSSVWNLFPRKVSGQQHSSEMSRNSAWLLEGQGRSEELWSWDVETLHFQMYSGSCLTKLRGRTGKYMDGVRQRSTRDRDKFSP